MVLTVPLLVTAGATSIQTGLSAASSSSAPIVTDFFPTSGAAGAEVTINGVNLLGATALWFNGITASFREGFSGTNLVAVVPAQAATGPITVITPFGSYTTAQNFVVAAAPLPEITSIEPENGPAGSTVVITGVNFTGVTKVTFNGVEAIFVPFGNTITAFVPVTASTGPIMVFTGAGTATSPGVFSVTTAGAPVITNVDPPNGRVGTRVTIVGQNLAGATSVTFNGVPAAFDVFGNSILATVPTTTSGPIRVVTPAGSALSQDAFKVIDPLAPEISGFTPTAAPPGSTVTVMGTNLLQVTEVRLGGVAAEIKQVSDSEVQIVVPAAATTGPISVVTPAGLAVSLDFFYVPSVVLSFEPRHGPIGTTVTIQGLHLTDVLAVLFNGVSASFTSVSANELSATVPEGATSGVISIATPAGFSRTASPFFLPPVISRFDPASALPLSPVTITGENLTGVTSVRFAGVEAEFGHVFPTSLIATVPASAGHGPITLSTPGGTAVSSENFTVGLFSDLAVELSATPDSVNMGDFLSYTITVGNRGPSEAPQVVVTERLPAGVIMIFSPTGANCVETSGSIVCELGALAPGIEQTIKISTIVTGGPYLTNEVRVTTSGVDPDLSNNSASLLTILEGYPPPPGETEVSLGASLEGGFLQLWWPSDVTDHQLEAAASLVPPVTWSAVDSNQVVADGKRTVRISPSAKGSFYRLRKP